MHRGLVVCAPCACLGRRPGPRAHPRAGRRCRACAGACPRSKASLGGRCPLCRMRTCLDDTCGGETELHAQLAPPEVEPEPEPPHEQHKQEEQQHQQQVQEQHEQLTHLTSFSCAYSSSGLRISSASAGMLGGCGTTAKAAPASSTSVRNSRSWIDSGRSGGGTKIVLLPKSYRTRRVRGSQETANALRKQA